MSALSRLLREAEGGRLRFRCPGCNDLHQISVGDGPGPRWRYNGDPERPTFSPSIRVTYNGSDADTPEGIPSVCHSFVTDGRIQFCADSTHKLAGQTVDLPDFDS